MRRCRVWKTGLKSIAFKLSAEAFLLPFPGTGGSGVRFGCRRLAQHVFAGLGTTNALANHGYLFNDPAPVVATALR